MDTHDTATEGEMVVCPFHIPGKLMACSSCNGSGKIPKGVLVTAAIDGVRPRWKLMPLRPGLSADGWDG